MSAHEDSPKAKFSTRQLRAGLGAVAVALLVAAMALDTKVVVIGSEEDVQDDSFSPEEFGKTKFPDIRAFVQNRAVPAAKLAAEIAEDQTAAGEKYGTPAGIGAVVPVTLTGVAGEPSSGVYPVEVEGVPDDVTIRVQTGPAINGTDLRDAPGNIEFGQFTNQIEYQNAGAALNTAMKQRVLAGIDTGSLSGKTISVTGVFKLINPANWLVTPVQMSVQ